MHNRTSQIFALATLLIAGTFAVTSPSEATAQTAPELSAPTLESGNGGLDLFQNNASQGTSGLKAEGDTSNSGGSSSGEAAGPEKMMIRAGAGGAYQTGLGNNADALNLSLNGVFELNNLRFFVEGGWLAGSEAGASVPAETGFYASGFEVGGGAGYKLTLVGDDAAGVYGQVGGFYQGVAGCQNREFTGSDCDNVYDTNQPGFEATMELGGFVPAGGNSQAHIAATSSISSHFGFMIGATARWEYRIFGVTR